MSTTNDDDVRLPDVAFRLLRYGDERGQYGQDSFRIFCAIIGHAVNAGFPPNKLYALMRDPRNVGGNFTRFTMSKSGRFRERGDEQSRRTFDRMWSKTVASRDVFHNATDARVWLGSLRGLVIASIYFSGRAGESRRRVLLAHVDVALKVGSTRYSRSLASLSDLAKVSDSTLKRAHRKLREDGLIEVVSAGTWEQATVWRIGRRAADVLTTGAEVTPIGSPLSGGYMGVNTAPADLLLHDAFSTPPRGSGNSKLDGTTWVALSPVESSTPREVAVLTGTTRVKTARARLQALERYGLAKQVASGQWVRIGDEAALDHVAVENGTRRCIDKRKAKREDDRRIARNEREAAIARWNFKFVYVEGYGIVNRDTGELLATANLPSGDEIASEADERKAARRKVFVATMMQKLTAGQTVPVRGGDSDPLTGITDLATWRTRRLRDYRRELRNPDGRVIGLLDTKTGVTTLYDRPFQDFLWLQHGVSMTRFGNPVELLPAAF